MGVKVNLRGKKNSHRDLSAMGERAFKTYHTDNIPTQLLKRYIEKPSLYYDHRSSQP